MRCKHKWAVQDNYSHRCVKCKVYRSRGLFYWYYWPAEGGFTWYYKRKVKTARPI